MATDAKSHVAIGDYQYGFHDPTDEYVFTSRKGLAAEIVTQISELKKAPDWLRQVRLEQLVWQRDGFREHRWCQNAGDDPTSHFSHFSHFFHSSHHSLN